MYMNGKRDVFIEKKNPNAAKKIKSHRMALRKCRTLFGCLLVSLNTEEKQQIHILPYYQSIRFDAVNLRTVVLFRLKKNHFDYVSFSLAILFRKFAVAVFLFQCSTPAS